MNPIEYVMNPMKLKAGVYRVCGNLILVKTPGHCLRGVGHNRRGNATKKGFTWKLYKTSLNNDEVLEALGVTNRSLFGAVMAEEFESRADALRAHRLRLSGHLLPETVIRDYENALVSEPLRVEPQGFSADTGFAPWELAALDQAFGGFLIE